MSVKRELQRLVKWSCLFLILVAFCDWVVGTVMEVLYYRQTSGFLFRTTELLEKVDDDIVILGDSRANHHYDPGIIESIVGRSVTNGGREGQNIFFYYGCLKVLLERHTPEIVVVEVSPYELLSEMGAYQRMKALYPYVRRYPCLKEVVDWGGAKERVKLMSHTYRYNSLILSMLLGHAEFNKERTKTFKGFSALSGEMSAAKASRKRIPFVSDVDENKVECLHRIVSLCASHDVELVVAISPVFDAGPEMIESCDYLKEVLSDEGVVLHDMLTDPAFARQRSCFRDFSHLNRMGAEEYSKIFARELKSRFTKD